MNVPIEALLQPLYEEEKAAYFADLSQDTPEDVSALHKAIIIDSLTNVKNFMSSFGVIVQDFFDPNKSRFSLHPIKGGKGGKGEAFPALSGKQTGKSGSTHRPKEPNPRPKQGESVPLVLHKPPTKAGGTALPPAVEQPTTPKPGVGSTVTVEPVPKTESVVLDPPKPKEEAVPAIEQPKAKMETVIQQHPPKAEEKAVAVTDQPKAGGQSEPLLSFAGIKGRLGFGPSKPAKPPPVSQDDSARLEEDEEADVQAAIQESLKAPTSPQVQSGAQSLTLKPMDLEQQESDLMTQLDKLMAETLRFETIPDPSIRDSSRMRSIEGVTQGIVKQLEEIAQKRSQSSPPALSSQTSKVQSVMPIAAPPASRPDIPSAQVKAVSPPKSKPLTIEKLIQDMSGEQDPSAVLGGTSQPPPPDTDIQHQPKTPSVREPDPSRLRSRERTPARQPRSATPQREAQPSLPAIEDGSPPKKEVIQESSRERERTPPKERSHERRRRRRSPSRDRSSEKRQRSPTPTKDRSHRRKEKSPSPIRDHISEERQRSPTPPKERSRRRRDRTPDERRRSPTPSKECPHDRRRCSPTPSYDRLSEEKRPSPPPSREPSRERRRRRRSPEPSEISREERRRSPSPKVVSPESPKVSSKKSKKSGKKEKNLCRTGQHVKKDLDLLEDRNRHQHRDLKLYKLKCLKPTNIHLGMNAN